MVKASRTPSGDGHQRCVCCYLKSNDECVAFGGQVPERLTVVVPDQRPPGGSRPWGAPRYIKDWKKKLDREEEALMSKASTQMSKVVDLLETVDRGVALQFLEVSSCCDGRVDHILRFIIFRCFVYRNILLQLVFSTSMMP